MHGLTVVAAPTAEPVTVGELKTHLRIDHSEEDVLLAALIAAAREWCENFTRRTFLPTTLRYAADGFPGGNGAARTHIDLPRPPLVSVSSVTYIDETGATQVWSSANYAVDSYREPGRLAPVYDKVWPGTRDIENAVVIQYVAGYGATDAAALPLIPARVKHAIRLLAAHWFFNREAVALGTIATQVPLAVESLLWSLRWGGYP